MKWKAFLGILLILCSILAMYLWETKYRDRLLLCDITVASQNIAEGDILCESMLKVIKATPDSKVADSLSIDNISSYLGLPATHDISENQQLIPSDFSKPESKTLNGKSVFVIPSSWIYSRPASVRAGDIVEAYLLPEKDYIGSFDVVYIRDSSEQPITVDDGKDITARNTSTSVICEVDILCSKYEYFRLYDIVTEKGSACLLLVLCENPV